MWVGVGAHPPTVGNLTHLRVYLSSLCLHHPYGKRFLTGVYGQELGNDRKLYIWGLQLFQTDAQPTLGL